MIHSLIAVITLVGLGGAQARSPSKAPKPKPSPSPPRPKPWLRLDDPPDDGQGLRPFWRPSVVHCYAGNGNWSACAGDHLPYPPRSRDEILSRNPVRLNSNFNMELVVLSSSLTGLLLLRLLCPVSSISSALAPRCSSAADLFARTVLLVATGLEEHRTATYYVPGQQKVRHGVEGHQQCQLSHQKCDVHTTCPPHLCRQPTSYTTTATPRTYDAVSA